MFDVGEVLHPCFAKPDPVLVTTRAETQMYMYVKEVQFKGLAQDVLVSHQLITL